jgi:hypothetical protein
MGLIRVLAEFGLCASLAQQIPALVEFTLQFAEALLFFLRIDLALLGGIPQFPFLFHHRRYPAENFSLIHCSSKGSQLHHDLTRRHVIWRSPVSFTEL